MAAFAPKDSYRVTLPENEIPRQWYNIVPDLPGELAPPLHPATGEPLTPDDLLALFPPASIEQEISQERWVDIPEPVQAIYRQWRSTPLYRAYRLEQALDTTARIYYK
ncbi:MAG: TrpB-like pyridoxal-phosphate dependent enzyme, partial [Cellulomonadaceae bacterium]|nr:TrpB-like pyridoxal-phosphate dependent enzyme [Cellulomonadaceae bacterium]